MAAQFVKLLKPSEEAPEFLTIKIKDAVYQLKFGDVFKVSAKCDAENKVADLSTEPYKLVHPEFVKQLENQFELIKQGEK